MIALYVTLTLANATFVLMARVVLRDIARERRRLARERSEIERRR